jgi:hypothetical protein
MADTPKVPEEFIPEEYRAAFLDSVEMTPELVRLLERGLLGDSLPPVLKTSRAAQAFQQAFELIGGVPRLAHWAHQNPGKFYPLYSRLVPSTTQINEKKDINVTISWASNERLSYQNSPNSPNVVEMAPRPAGVEGQGMKTLQGPLND